MGNTAEMEGGDINTMSCPIILNSNTIELTVRTPCYCGLRLTVCNLSGSLDNFTNPISKTASNNNFVES